MELLQGWTQGLRRGRWGPFQPPEGAGGGRDLEKGLRWPDCPNAGRKILSMVASRPPLPQTMGFWHMSTNMLTRVKGHRVHFGKQVPTPPPAFEGGEQKNNML